MSNYEISNYEVFIYATGFVAFLYIIVKVVLFAFYDSKERHDERLIQNRWNYMSKLSKKTEVKHSSEGGEDERP